MPAILLLFISGIMLLGFGLLCAALWFLVPAIAALALWGGLSLIGVKVSFLATLLFAAAVKLLIRAGCAICNS